MIDNRTCTVLAEAAIDAMNNAYAPYSGMKVGAALLTKSGEIITGCNVENSAFSPTCCAERVAIFKAISEGHREFLGIAVAGGRDGKINDVYPPCGVCRQVMAEFCDPDKFEVIMVTPDRYEILPLSHLLPYRFGYEL